MTLVTFLLALRRRAWIPVLFAAIATLAIGAITLRSKPSYTATATVIAKNPENATDRPLSFPEVVTSNTVAIRAIKTAHVEESVDELEKSLSVVSGKSDIYQVAIRDSDPARATALANAVATESTAYYQDLAGGDTVSIQATIDKDRADLNKRYLDASQALLAFDQAHPQVAGARIDPGLGAQRLALQLAQQATANAVLNFEAGITQGKVTQITTIRNFEAHVLDQAAPIAGGGAKLPRVAYAGGLGLVLGLALIFLLEYFGRSINKPEDAEAYLGAPVVGVIPRANARAMRRAAGDK
jgi:capsular polysaccharide biosynthesis protein